MLRMKFIMLFAFFAAFALISVTPINALTCYTCDRTMTGCAPPFNSAAASSTPGCTACGTFQTVISGVKYYERGCAVDTLSLNLIGVDSIGAIRCKTDLCNTGSITVSNTVGSVRCTVITVILTTIAAKLKLA
jgi:hypothetical protein